MTAGSSDREELEDCRLPLLSVQDRVVGIGGSQADGSWLRLSSSNHNSTLPASAQACPYFLYGFCPCLKPLIVDT